MDRTLEIISSSLWPLLRAGLLVTIPLALVSFAIGLVIAVAAALGRLYGNKLISFIAKTYIWIFRGTPLLVQLYIVFYGLPNAGIIIDAFPAAVLALSLNVGAYAAEAIRSAILSIPEGQWEAAYSIGMSKPKVLWRIIAPQAARVSLPPLSNTFISLVKDTSLTSAITMTEMFRTAQQIAARTYEILLLYILAAAYYLLFCTVLTWVQAKLEDKFTMGDQEGGKA